MQTYCIHFLFLYHISLIFHLRRKSCTVGQQEKLQQLKCIFRHVCFFFLYIYTHTLLIQHPLPVHNAKTIQLHKKYVHIISTFQGLKDYQKNYSMTFNSRKTYQTEVHCINQVSCVFTSFHRAENKDQENIHCLVTGMVTPSFN